MLAFTKGAIYGGMMQGQPISASLPFRFAPPGLWSYGMHIVGYALSSRFSEHIIFYRYCYRATIQRYIFSVAKVLEGRFATSP